ncbi:MAG: hypothetical protein FWF87_00500 [Synergistaceae bacterium]|nr:hypothetical protein [Synergistaceae bacterium]
MDIECARVDFNSAREEIYNKLNKQYNPVSKKYCFFKFIRTAIASTVILLSIAAPISFMETTFSAIATNSSLEWVNSDEKTLLRNLREQLSNANVGWVSDLTDSPVIDYSDSPKDEIKREQKGQTSAGKNITEEKPLKNSRADIRSETQIFTLLKIGENALKNKPSAVIVER